MQSTQALLARISALRQRLEQSQVSNGPAEAFFSDAQDDWENPTGKVQAVEKQIKDDGEHDLAMDQALDSTAPTEPACHLPRQLTSRARRVLEKARDLLGQLRSLSEAFAPPSPTPGLDESNEIQIDTADPLARHYRETAAIADTTLRMIPQFPDSATGQLHLCSGLEGILDVVEWRLRALAAGVERHRHETEMVHRLADLLSAVASGQLRELAPFTELAQGIHAESQEGGPLRFLAGPVSQPARNVAAHGLTVARVIARIVGHDAELKARPLDSIVAALVHDVGMLRVPADILSTKGPLSDEQRREVESHCRLGANLLQPLQGQSTALVQAVGSHHEKLDGTGYPDGLKKAQLTALPRLLAVCDCYVAMCSTRPHRPACETRTALTDTLLLADQGQLDRQHAEHLLLLSFYPVGSAVEMADGSLAVVVATPQRKRDLHAPSRPVVALLLDPDGCPFPLPSFIDLAHSNHHSIVRALTPEERRQLLGPRFPEWLAA